MGNHQRSWINGIPKCSLDFFHDLPSCKTSREMLLEKDLSGPNAKVNNSSPQRPFFGGELLSFRIFAFHRSFSSDKSISPFPLLSFWWFDPLPGSFCNYTWSPARLKPLGNTLQVSFWNCQLVSKTRSFDKWSGNRTIGQKDLNLVRQCHRTTSTGSSVSIRAAHMSNKCSYVMRVVFN